MRNHPFSRADIQVLIAIHIALVGCVIAFGGLTVFFNFRNSEVGAGIIPAFLNATAYVNLFLPVLALAASRALLSARVAGACRKLREREIHIETFKQDLRSAYLLRAALTGLPALLGLAAVLAVALRPGNIFDAPPLHLAHFLGALLFVAETLRILPTESRLTAALGEYAQA